MWSSSAGSGFAIGRADAAVFMSLVSAWLGIQAFTLAWSKKRLGRGGWRSTEKTWPLRRGFGVAGLEPPLDAQFSDGVWHYRPAIEAQARVLLTHSPYVLGTKFCYPERVAPCRFVAGSARDYKYIELDFRRRSEVDGTSLLLGVFSSA